MSSNTSGNAGKIWGIAIAVGIIAFLILRFWAKYMFGPAILLAILIAILVAILLWIGFYRPAEESGGSISAPRHGVPGATGGTASGATSAAAPAGSGLARGPEAERNTAAALMGDAGRKLAQGSATGEGGASAQDQGKAPAERDASGSEGAASAKAGAARADAEKPANPAAPAKKPAKAASGDAGKGKAGSAGASKAKAASKPKKAAKGSSAKAARKPVAPDGKPELLSAPRDGKPDDLKMIKGVGPKLEKLLHSLGVYHFDQIASWRKKEVQWVDEHLEGFKGRVSRDEWVKQAKVLAKGGSTEFSKRVKKGKVY